MMRIQQHSTAAPTEHSMTHTHTHRHRHFVFDRTLLASLLLSSALFLGQQCQLTNAEQTAKHTRTGCIQLVAAQTRPSTSLTFGQPRRRRFAFAFAFAFEFAVHQNSNGREDVGVVRSVRSFRGGGSEKEKIEYDDEDEEEDESSNDEEEEQEFLDAVQEDFESNNESDDESNNKDDPILQQQLPQDNFSTDGIQIEVKVNKLYDPLVQSPINGLAVSLGVMFLSRKIDLFAPKYVRAARWAFVAYLLSMQAFLLYVRIIAKQQNDRTPIELQNPLLTILQNRIQPQNTQNDTVKNIATSFLSNKSTVLEYDLHQVRTMQWGILVSIIMQWLLHFKLEQIQPLIIAAIDGFLSLGYSPLFQVYVLGKNLERPFKTPIMMQHKLDPLDAAQATGPTTGIGIRVSSLPSDHTEIAPLIQHNDKEGTLPLSSNAEEYETDAEEYDDDDDDDASILINHPHDAESSLADSTPSTVNDESS